MIFFKRIFKMMLMALVVAVLAGLALTNSAQAATINDITVNQALQALEILPPAGQGSAIFDRATCARMLVQSSAARNTISGSGSISPFADVSFRHPAAGYIRAASQAGYMSAYADGNFQPAEPVNGGVAARAVLALLGYGREQYDVDYWQFASSLGLLDNLNISSTMNISQQQANRLFYNALRATNAAGHPQIEALGFTITNGVIDMQGIISKAASGPLTITNATWYKGTGLQTASLTVYRNDSPSTLAALQNYDVVYYNVGMNTAWAYSNKISGVFKSALPSRLSPVSVNISGMSYDLSEAAASKLAASSAEYGETLILLLGPDGKVADFLRQNSLAFDVTGFVIAADKFVGTDDAGQEYNGYTVTLITVDGSELTYEVRRNYSNMVGKLVKLSYNSGEIGVTTRLATNLYGPLDATNLTLGDMKLAPDVRILEVYANGAYDNTYLSRLDGVSIGEGKVLYYTKNADGAINAMFIYGVTGDLLQYGIITAVNESKPSASDSQSSSGDNTDTSGSSGGGTLSGFYSYVLDGKNGSSNVNGAVLNGQKGPAALMFKNGQLDSVKALEEVKKVKLYEAGYVLDSAGNRYLLAANTSIYQASGGEYKLLSQQQAMDLHTTFTAYYDKPQNEGGRVRILIAD